MKSCNKTNCGQINPQPLNEFYKGRGSCKSCHRKVTKKQDKTIWRAANPKRIKGHWLRKYWPDDNWDKALQNFNNLVKIQNNLCAICNKAESAIDGKTGNIRDLSVDHCHKTGKVRGLLCSTCNRALGYFKDNPILCMAGAKYLHSHEQI